MALIRNHPLYATWCSMKSRCFRKTAHNYAYYGGRGITVCDRWKDSFQAFAEDMGEKPGPEYRLERKDNDGPYSPENCCWATHSEQMSNRRKYSTPNQQGEKHHAAKITDEEAGAIRALAGLMPYRKIAKMFGVSHSTVGDIVNGRRRVHSSTI